MKVSIVTKESKIEVKISTKEVQKIVDGLIPDPAIVMAILQGLTSMAGKPEEGPEEGPKGDFEEGSKENPKGDPEEESKEDPKDYPFDNGECANTLLQVLSQLRKGRAYVHYMAGLAGSLDEGDWLLFEKFVHNAYSERSVIIRACLDELGPNDFADVARDLPMEEKRKLVTLLQLQIQLEKAKRDRDVSRVDPPAPEAPKDPQAAPCPWDPAE